VSKEREAGLSHNSHNNTIAQSTILRKRRPSSVILRETSGGVAGVKFGS